jgi:putative transposase
MIYANKETDDPAFFSRISIACDYCSNYGSYRHVRDPSKALIFHVSTSRTPAPIGAGTPRRNTRKVVGWSMKPSLTKELALDALLMAVWRRKPAGRVLVHSDQGSQYGSDDFKRFCQAHKLEPSMSRRANCWDNAVAESFFSSLKKERIGKRIYKTRDLARADIFDYIETFYNRTRRHSRLGGVSPEAFESAAA